MFGEVLQEECKEENVSARLAPYLHFMKIFENIVLGSLLIIEGCDLSGQLNWAMQGVLSSQERQPGGQGRQM